MSMSKEEKDNLYQSFLRSGLSCKEFALRNNVSPSVLRGLISYRKRVEQKEQSGFINVSLNKSQSSIVHPSNKIEFVLDNHHIQIDESFLKQFLRSFL